MGMNLLRIYGATLLVALTMGMSACKNEDAPVTAPAVKAEANSGQKISLNVDIEGLSSSDLRAMEIQENIVGNQHAGLKFKWTIGSTEKFFIAFKKESGSSFTASGPMVVRESTLKILSQEGSRYKARIDVDAPSGFNPDTETIFVAGALGVKGIDATTGRALVPGPRYFFEKGKSYIPPMYFAPTRLRSKTVGGSKEYYADNLTFRFYGAMVGATIDNTQGNMLYSPHEITMKTGALTTEGEINLFDFETDANNQSVPKWTTTQNATTAQRVYFEQGDVAVGKKRTYYFWAVPSKFSGRREMTMEFRTDAYDNLLKETEADITTKWKVKQLASAKVHRLSVEIPAPKGELIISEVFFGGGLSATAWEFYNPTEAPVDLRKYSLRRYDRTSTGDYSTTPDATTRLYQPASFREVHVDNSGRLGVNQYILPPHKTIVYVASGVQLYFDKSRLAARPGLAYMYGFASHIAVTGDKEWPKAFYSNKSTRYLLVKSKPGGYDEVDAFFWYEDNGAAHYPTATYMRKPGRDLPRKRMHLKSNSDWVMRHRIEGLDWGYRFGYYFDRERLGGAAHGAHWLDDTSTGPNLPILSAKNGLVKERPIFAPDFRTGDLTFDQLKAQAKTSQYTPPMWWTKERAQAADR